jgi:hypothetical protein
VKLVRLSGALMTKLREVSQGGEHNATGKTEGA